MNDEKGDLRKRSKGFVFSLVKNYEASPLSGSGHVSVHQVLKSGTSVGANFREANRARSSAEFVSKAGDSLKELEEAAYWLELLVDSKTVMQRIRARL